MKIIQSRWLSISWFLLMCILFFLPGSALPKETSWMALISFDKWIHAGLFATLVFLFHTSFDYHLKYYGLYLFLLSVLFGFSVEVIQLKWIPNRSFDLLDVVADTFGSALGLGFWTLLNRKFVVYTKK